MLRDPTIENLTELLPDIRARAIELVNAARAAGVPLIITSGRRTLDEQRLLVNSGRSRTLRSKHLEGRAFDVDVLGLNRDAVPRWWFAALGSYGESLGLKWGGRWQTIYDPGHFEL